MTAIVRRVVRQVILANELATSREGLRHLVVWLTRIADDFEAHGANVRDIRTAVERIRAQLRRQGGMEVV